MHERGVRIECWSVFMKKWKGNVQQESLIYERGERRAFVRALLKRIFFKRDVGDAMAYWILYFSGIHIGLLQE